MRRSVISLDLLWGNPIDRPGPVGSKEAHRTRARSLSSGISAYMIATMGERSVPQLNTVSLASREEQTGLSTTPQMAIPRGWLIVRSEW